MYTKKWKQGVSNLKDVPFPFYDDYVLLSDNKHSFLYSHIIIHYTKILWINTLHTSRSTSKRSICHFLILYDRM